jgi:steroid delta-isomerase-like uncharacterized protein
MSAENKAIVRRLFEEGFNEGKLELLDELVAPNFVNRSPQPGLPPTREGWKQSAAGMRAAFPDMHVHIDDEIAEGDRVVNRFTAHGTQKGEMMGIPATGKEVSVTGISIHRLAGGKIVERWEEWDAMSMMVQLGAIPPPGA